MGMWCANMLVALHLYEILVAAFKTILFHSEASGGHY